jgi:small subunit ribosomal protein S9
MAFINPWTWGLGRRKKAVARVRLKAGSGALVVNGRPVEQYFPTIQGQRAAWAPLQATESAHQYDVFCNVHGGGTIGQSEAVSLGIARALKVINPATFETLRQHGLLTRDSREKERKKYGRRGARRGFQFSKR